MRVAAYASKPLSKVEHQFSDCENVFLSTVYTAHQYVLDLRIFRSTFAWSQKNLEASTQGSKAYYDQKETEVGDKVFYFHFAQETGTSRKFLPSLNGPFEGRPHYTNGSMPSK